LVPYLLQRRRHGVLHRLDPLILVAIGLLTLVICGPFIAMGLEMANVALTTRPGVGDVALAKSKIKNGMSTDEVRSLLGSPHREETDEWDYWEHKFVGSVLRVRFGSDDRVTSSEWWVQ
jgi:hypothetical protein